MQTNTSSQSALPSKAARRSRQKRRLLTDRLGRYGVAIGGVSVIIAITLIFFYLLLVVAPLFKPVHVEELGQYAMPGSGQTILLATEEQAEIGLQVNNSGQASFFRLENGASILEHDLQPMADISSVARANPASAVFGLGLANGQAIVARAEYKVSYPNNQRVITPVITYPLGEEPLQVDEAGSALQALALQHSEDGIALAALTADQRLQIAAYVAEESLFADELTFERLGASMSLDEPVQKLLLDKEQRTLYVITRDGRVVVIDISDKEEPEQVETVRVLPEGMEVRDARFLPGTISLLITGADGSITQWFRVRDENNIFHLTRIRDFEAPAGKAQIVQTEYFRKAFIAADNQGNVAMYHATADSQVFSEPLVSGPVQTLAMSPRADMLLLETGDGRLHRFKVDNEHPEISWSALWSKVWYEGYEEPEYIWQSSSSSNDFEPKLSLAPLSFGTLKAAFYAMLLAVPLAILGAIYTAYFMAPKLRQTVKPTIEIMEALPTVILGFLAGLWLAPFLESNLPGVFALLVIMPLGVLVFAYLWTRFPEKIRHLLPEGWAPILLLPVIMVIGWAAVGLSPAMEEVLFGGDMPMWLREELGVSFDQRNSVVVGLAMGFAVIPTIFSIAEDAIFSVPRHLTNGSLALGATPWQTFTRVVLLTASPGIFSGVMIGFGRAVGETMIVLMATGNTAVMDFSIFQGMRTLSANIAVEMPESEVGSTHYRVLFLAALVLFVFTFFFNTLAELVRQRLRAKYSSL